MSGAREPRSVVVAVTTETVATGFLRGYLASLADHGFSTTIAAPSDGGLEAFARAEGAQAVAVPMARHPEPIADLRSLLALVRLLRARRPEILMTATPKASLLGMLAGAATGVPVRVYQLWGLRGETSTGLRGRVLDAAEALTMRLATHVVANSPSLAAEAQRLAGAKRIEVVGEGSSHGVDLARFSASAPMPELPPAAAEALHDAPLVVGFVGRICRDKGVPSLVDAVRLVARRRPLLLLAVGHPEDAASVAALDRLRDDAAVLRVDDVEDTRPWFRAMDVHVLPTLREGFPNVVLEAAALGIPTITTTATGARDAVIPEVTGLLVPPDRPDELAAAIERLAGDAALRRRLAAEARDRVEAAFEQRHVWALQAAMLERARTDRSGGSGGSVGSVGSGRARGAARAEPSSRRPA